MRRISSIILMTFLASCTQEPTPLLSVNDLLHEKSQYDQKNVRVCGILHDNVEYCGLENNVPEFRGAIDSRGRKIFEVDPSVWVDPGRDMCMPGKELPMGGKVSTSWAIIEGIFMTGGKYGHLDGFDSQIVATKIQLLKASCRTTTRNGT